MEQRARDEAERVRVQREAEAEAEEARIAELIRKAREEERMEGKSTGAVAPAPRVVIVTGGSRGIGAATCVLLAERGYSVCVNYNRGAAEAAAVVDEITAAGGSAVAVQADVSVPVDVARLFAEAEAALGRVSCLVNNAGIIGPRTGLGDGGDGEELVRELEKVLRVNVHGPLLCCREALRHMSTQAPVSGAGGAIVNISSGSAFIGSPLLYAMSKGALNSMQSGLVKELAGHGIRVNSVSPGMTRTEMVTDEVGNILGV